MTQELTQQDNGIGWYGKIPGCGDFVQRRLPEPLVNRWAHWIQSGLAALQLSAPRDGRYSLAGAARWNFILPATLGTPFVQLGYLLPSQDRVGRHYPLFALWLIEPDAWRGDLLAQAQARCYHIGRILRHGVHQRHSAERIDRALLALPGQSAAEAVTGAQTAWPAAGEDFDPHRYGSFWWSDTTGGRPFETYIHSGNLTVQLFHHLFTPVGGIGYTRRGPYGQMFDQGETR